MLHVFMTAVTFAAWRRGLYWYGCDCLNGPVRSKESVWFTDFLGNRDVTDRLCFILPFSFFWGGFVWIRVGARGSNDSTSSGDSKTWKYDALELYVKCMRQDSVPRPRKLEGNCSWARGIWIFHQVERQSELGLPQQPQSRLLWCINVKIMA